MGAGGNRINGADINDIRFPFFFFFFYLLPEIAQASRIVSFDRPNLENFRLSWTSGSFVAALVAKYYYGKNSAYRCNGN